MTKSLPYKNKTNYLKSPLNYIGGKHKILSQIFPLFPKKSDIFLDLFCGGCNVGVNIGQDYHLGVLDSLPQAQKIICNDNLSYLIELYQFLQNNTLECILEQIDTIIAKYHLSLYNIQGYNALRFDYNTHKSPILLFVLIAFSFNHQIRFNNTHQFNNPFGKNRSSFNLSMKNNLIAFTQSLQNKNISFLNLDFKQALESTALNNQSFVYADPPYLIAQGTYNDGKRGFSGWNETFERELLEWLQILDSKGIKFALSNVLTHKGVCNGILQKWIQTYHYFVYPIQRHYTNANYQTKHKDKTQTLEVLITNYQSLHCFNKSMF